MHLKTTGFLTIIAYTMLCNLVQYNIVRHLLPPPLLQPLLPPLLPLDPPYHLMSFNEFKPIKSTSTPNLVQSYHSQLRIVYLYKFRLLDVALRLIGTWSARSFIRSQSQQQRWSGAVRLEDAMYLSQYLGLLPAPDCALQLRRINGSTQGKMMIDN